MVRQGVTCPDVLACPCTGGSHSQDHAAVRRRKRCGMRRHLVLSPRGGQGRAQGTSRLCREAYLGSSRAWAGLMALTGCRQEDRAGNAIALLRAQCPVIPADMTVVVAGLLIFHNLPLILCVICPCSVRAANLSGACMPLHLHIFTDGHTMPPLCGQGSSPPPLHVA